MSDTSMDELFGMMKIAKTQQEAVQAALEGLAAERGALAQQAEALKSAAGDVSNVAANIRKAASDAIPAIQKAAGEAVGASVRQSLVGASDAAAKALGEAARPVIGTLSGVVQSAGEAEASLKNAGQWFAWKWVAVAAGGLGGVCLVAYAALAWQVLQVESLDGQKAALLSEVAQLQANAEGWSARGGRAKLEKCGDKGRLCVRVDKATAYGKGSDYYVLRGY